MGQKQTSRLGPVLCGTVLCTALEESVSAYTDFLEMRGIDSGVVDAETAAVWRLPQLLGAPFAVLASQSGVAWLRLIEAPQVGIASPFKQRGWMSLEVLVEDVDALALRLRDSPFRILAEPAGLDVNPEIRAFQVAGPSGEVLYLTRVGGSTPVFELPERAACAVDRLFVGVLSVEDRDRSREFWEKLAGGRGHCFETRLGAANLAWGYPRERRHPVCVLQFAGLSLLEIDQLPEALPVSTDHSQLSPGIAMLSFAVSDLGDLPLLQDVDVHMGRLAGALYRGRRTVFLRGMDGEGIELIENPEGRA